MYCDSCAMFARSSSWRRTSASLSRRRLATGHVSKCDDEQHERPKNPAVTYSVAELPSVMSDEYLLHQHGQRGHGGDQQRIAAVGEHGQRQHRQHQQDASPLSTPPLA